MMSLRAVERRLKIVEERLIHSLEIPILIIREKDFSAGNLPQGVTKNTNVILIKARKARVGDGGESCINF